MDRAGWSARVRQVRDATTARISGLDAEDCLVQSMPDASPLKWHLAHTTWFFETFVLGPLGRATARDPRWDFLFNSYYETAGPRQPRARRGDLSRPSLAEVLAWRARVDEALLAWLEGDDAPGSAADALELGLQHEQQHQELMVTDLKHHLWSNPLRPAWQAVHPAPAPGPASFVGFDGGLVELGATDDGFAFDNERPRHRVWLAPFALADRPVTVGQWQDFVADGGYDQPLLWLSDGWAWRRAHGIDRPLYWEDDGLYTLAGPRAHDPDEPVCHVSFYEADAFARWAGARLPTEAEWEHGITAGGARLAPGNGQVWQWTASGYGPYPGYRPPAGAFGEYNGKFMCNQLVLRGGSCATPSGHARPTYRNFFYPKDRWQFLGLRLARDA